MTATVIAHHPAAVGNRVLWNRANRELLDDPAPHQPAPVAYLVVIEVHPGYVRFACDRAAFLGYIEVPVGGEAALPDAPGWTAGVIGVWGLDLPPHLRHANVWLQYDGVQRPSPGRAAERSPF